MTKAQFEAILQHATTVAKAQGGNADKDKKLAALHKDYIKKRDEVDGRLFEKLEQGLERLFEELEEDVEKEL